MHAALYSDIGSEHSLHSRATPAPAITGPAPAGAMEAAVSSGASHSPMTCSSLSPSTAAASAGAVLAAARAMSPPGAMSPASGYSPMSTAASAVQVPGRLTPGGQAHLQVGGRWGPVRRCTRACPGTPCRAFHRFWHGRRKAAWGLPLRAQHASQADTALHCAAWGLQGLVGRSDSEPAMRLSGAQALALSKMRGSASFTVVTGGPVHKRMLSALVSGVQERVHQVGGPAWVSGAHTDRANGRAAQQPDGRSLHALLLHAGPAAAVRSLTPYTEPVDRSRCNMCVHVCARLRAPSMEARSVDPLLALWLVGLNPSLNPYCLQAQRRNVSQHTLAARSDDLRSLVVSRKIGSGGFGSVYLGAYQGAEVAIKVWCSPSHRIPPHACMCGGTASRAHPRSSAQLVHQTLNANANASVSRRPVLPLTQGVCWRCGSPCPGKASCASRGSERAWQRCELACVFQVAHRRIQSVHACGTRYIS